MDFFSHAFWTATLYKILQKKTKKPLNLWRATFWGTFPDLFAFGIPVLLIITELLLGKISLSDLPSPEKIEPPRQNFFPILNIVSTLYTISHSLVIFFAAVIVWAAILYFKRKSVFSATKAIPWELGGWMIHILIDIPTHSTKFYATPFLWPISDIKFSGLSWGTPWFLILDYAAIIAVYFIVWRKNKS